MNPLIIKFLRTVYLAGYEAGAEAQAQAVSTSPQAISQPEASSITSRLGQAALDHIQIQQALAALQEAEPDLSRLEDAELIKRIAYRGYAEQQRAEADAAYQELERRHGPQGLFKLLGILGGF